MPTIPYMPFTPETLFLAVVLLISRLSIGLSVRHDDDGDE
jgi:hypothetical protein